MFNRVSVAHGNTGMPQKRDNPMYRVNRSTVVSGLVTMPIIIVDFCDILL